MTTEAPAPSAEGAAKSPFFNSNLRRRLVSAAIGIPLLVAAVWGGLPGVVAVTLAASVLAMFELATFALEAKFRRWWISFPAAGVPAAGVTYALLGGSSDRADIVPVLAIGVALQALFSASVDTGALRRNSRLTAWAAIYTGALLAHAPGIATLDNGRSWLLVAIFGTFAVDSAAYFTGRTIGKRKLAPRISPKKTWEGAIAGLAAGPAAVLAINSATGLGLPAWEAALIGLAVAFAGTLGDLAESALKRAVGVKDSSALIPGHGGILDRIDSLAPNLATVYWLAQWTGV